METFIGVIIEESLEKKDVLKKIKTTQTKIVPVTEKHRTPWVKTWTMHTVEIPENKAREIAEELSKVLDSKHEWYADYKNNTHHYIIYRNKVFFINRKHRGEYLEAREYGISLGIPEYQVNFEADLI